MDDVSESIIIIKQRGDWFPKDEDNEGVVGVHA